MRKLTYHEKQRLIAVVEYGKTIKRLQTPEEFHQVLYNYNWDDGHKAVQWILDRPDCDLGTACFAFWLAQGWYHTRYADRDSAPEYSRRDYDFVRRLVDRIASGHYTRQEFGFDPTNDFAANPDSPQYAENWTASYNADEAAWKIAPAALTRMPRELARQAGREIT